MIDVFFALALTAAQAATPSPVASSVVLPDTQACSPALPAPALTPDSQAADPPAGTFASFLGDHDPTYIIGVDDVLTIRFWREDSLSGDVIVRSDGMISLPLINDIQAAGLTPLELCSRVTRAAEAFVQSPTVSVIVKQVNSRKVYVSGMVGSSGAIPLSGQMTVMQLIAVAGGLSDYADADNVRVIRTENGRTMVFNVDYDDLTKGKKLEQNIVLKPGDIIVVR